LILIPDCKSPAFKPDAGGGLLIGHRRLRSASGEDSPRTHQDHSSHPGKLRLAVKHFKPRADHTERRSQLKQRLAASHDLCRGRAPRINDIGIEVRMTVSSAVTAVDLLFGSRKIEGALRGNPATGDATHRFSALSGIAAMIETMPLERAPEAYAKTMAGKARFRMVLTMA
jgi:hypothetical protein